MEEASKEEKRKSLSKSIAHYLVEIVVIFIGITISFVFDRWQESRSNREKKIEYVKALLIDLYLEKEDITNDLNSVNEFLQKTDSLIFSYNSEKELSTKLIDYFYFRDRAVISFKSSTPAYNRSSINERWQELPDTLKRRIFLLYEGNFTFLELLYQRTNEIRYDFLQNFYLKNKVFLVKGASDLRKVDYKKLNSLFFSEQYVNDHIMMRENASGISKSYLLALNEINLLIKDLEIYVTKL